MAVDSSALLERLSQLQSRFRSRLDDIRRMIEDLEQGIPPHEDLLEHLTVLRQEFEELSNAVRAAAMELLPDAEGADFGSLPAIAASLEKLREAEAHGSRAAARQVLQDLLALRHVEDPTFEPLVEAQEQARRLLAGLESPGQVNPDDGEVAALAGGSHPLCWLLRLARDHDRLDDATWQAHLEEVGRVFGKQLAAAASRGKLEVRPPAPPPEDDGPPAEVRPTQEHVGDSLQTAPQAAEQEARQAEETEVPEPEAAPEKAEVPVPWATVESVGDSLGAVPEGEPEVATEAEPEVVPDAESDDGVFGDEPGGAETSGARLAVPSGVLVDACALSLSLLADERYSLAYWITRTLEELGEACTVPSWVIRSVVLGRHVKRSEGTMAGVLARDFQRIAELPDEGDLMPLSLLLLAAAMRPALVAPLTDAGSALYYAIEHLGLSELYQFVKPIAEFTAYNHPLDPEALEDIRRHLSWRREVDNVRREAEEWLQSATGRTLIYAPATNVWRYWVSNPDGIVVRLLRPVIDDRPDVRGEVERIRSTLEDRSEFGELVYDTDRNRLGRQHGKDITARAFEQLQDRTKEALNLVERWLKLYDQAPEEQGGFVRRRAREIRDQVLKGQDKVKQVLAELMASHPGPTADAARCCLKAVEDLASLFEEGSDGADVEAGPRHLLNADLLLIDWLRLDKNWEPENLGGDAQRLKEALLELADQPRDWEKAFGAHLEHSDFEATGRILEVLSLLPQPTETDPSELYERLAETHARQLQRAREALDLRLKRAERQVEDAVSLGLLSESERSHLMAEIALLKERNSDGHKDPILRFQDAHAAVDRVSQEIERLRNAEVAQVKQRLAELPQDTDPQALARIQEVLDRGDVLSANEYIDLLKEGELLPEEAGAADLFARFFPDGVRALEKFLYDQQNNIPGVLKRIRERKAVAGMTLKHLGSPQAHHAADVLERWFELKKQRRVYKTTVSTILEFLGFSPTKVEVVGGDGGVAGGARKAWVIVETETLEDRNLCPIPAYGSMARGKYRVLCLWDRPTQEDLLNEVGDTVFEDATIVFYFGRLSEKRRRDLAHICRERRRTVIVADDILMVYLATFPGPRLPVFFACTLPFTFCEPYTTTGGLVPPEMFYGRARERDAIMSPYGSCLIYGGRQLGKTALLQEVQRQFHNPEAGRLAVYIDLKARGVGVGRPIDDIWDVIARELKDLDVLSASVANQPNPDQLLRGIEAWLEEDSGRRILLLLDEADLFLESDAKDQFRRAASIRGWMDRTDRRLKVVLAGLHNVQRTTRQANHPLAQLGDPICIGPLLGGGEWRQSRMLVEKPLASLGFRFESPDLVTRILSLTNYYPSLIQLYCYYLLKHLHGPGRHMFRPEQVPPYVIQERHVEEAYRNEELRSAIRHRFRLTLALDPRYHLIANVIAYETLEASESLVEGFSVEFIREQVLGYWPEGFPDGAPIDAFRTLLDEMVGLGVLRLVERNRYALRSPNVRLLMGTKEEIEQAILEQRELPAEYEAATFRSAYTVGDLQWRSPLTNQQEVDLLQGDSPVTVLFGVEPADLEHVGPYLADRVVVLNDVVDKAGFMNRLNDLVGDKRRSRRVAYVPPSVPWTDFWVKDAVDRLSRVRNVKVVFASGPELTWQIEGQWRNAWRGMARSILEQTLRPWTDAALRQWLQDSELGSWQPERRRRLAEVTGLWPGLLMAFYEQARADAHRADHLLEEFSQELGKPEVARRWLTAFGITRQPVAYQVLSTLAQLREPTSVNDLAMLLEDLDRETVAHALRWADRLHLAHPGGRKGEQVLWSLDPLIQQLLLTARE